MYSVNTPSWSPDSKYLFFSGSAEYQHVSPEYLWKVDVATGTHQQWTTGDCGHAQPTLNGQTIVCAYYRSRPHVYRVPVAGTQEPELPQVPSDCLLAGTTELYILDQKDTLHRYSLATKTATPIAQAPAGARLLHLSADGRYLYVMTVGDTVHRTVLLTGLR